MCVRERERELTRQESTRELFDGTLPLTPGVPGAQKKSSEGAIVRRCNLLLPRQVCARCKHLCRIRKELFGALHVSKRASKNVSRACVLRILASINVLLALAL